MLIFSKQLLSHFVTLIFFTFEVMGSLCNLFLESQNIRRRDCWVITFISIFAILCENSGFFINFGCAFTTNSTIAFCKLCSVGISMKYLLVFALESINVHLTNIISKLKMKLTIKYTKYPITRNWCACYYTRIFEAFVDLYQKGFTFFCTMGKVNIKMGQYNNWRIKLTDNPW